MTHSDDREAGRRRSLASGFFPTIKSEYDELCDELGGSADIGLADAEHRLPMYCREYRLGQVRPILSKFQPDDVAVRRHWPWVSFGISQYKFEREVWAKYGGEPTPSEVVKLIANIKRTSGELRSALCQLHALSYRLTDPTTPLHRGHLSWLDAFISQAVAGRISPEANASGEELLLVHTGKEAQIRRLAEIEAAAIEAMQRADKKMLNCERRQSDPALPNFVFRCGMVWKSLTDRQPSANKVTRRDGTEDPDFVIFIQALAKLGKIPSPTRSQVASSLRKMAPSIKAAFNSKSKV